MQGFIDFFVFNFKLLKFLIQLFLCEIFLVLAPNLFKKLDPNFYFLLFLSIFFKLNLNLINIFEQFFLDFFFLIYFPWYIRYGVYFLDYFSLPEFHIFPSGLLLLITLFLKVIFDVFKFLYSYYPFRTFPSSLSTPFSSTHEVPSFLLHLLLSLLLLLFDLLQGKTWFKHCFLILHTILSQVFLLLLRFFAKLLINLIFHVFFWVLQNYFL